MALKFISEDQPRWLKTILYGIDGSGKSGFPYPTTLHLGTLSNKIPFLALSACVSPWIIHLKVLDRSPLLGPGRAPPSGNSTGGGVEQRFPHSTNSQDTSKMAYKSTQF